MQLIFTSCSNVCPIQGALFAEVQRRVEKNPPPRPVLLLSVSIDALRDTPEALAGWLVRMGARDHRWMAAVPTPVGIEALRASLGGSVTNIPGLNGHSENVFFFDGHGRLRWRSTPLPTAEEVMRVLRYMASASS